MLQQHYSLGNLSGGSILFLRQSYLLHFKFNQETTKFSRKSQYAMPRLAGTQEEVAGTLYEV